MSKQFITPHSNLNLTDCQVDFIDYLYLGLELSIDKKVDKFVIACMLFAIEPMDMLDKIVPFQTGWTEAVREETNFDDDFDSNWELDKD